MSESNDATVGAPEPGSSTADLVAYALLRRDLGDEKWAERALAIDPERAEEVRSALDQLGHLPELLDADLEDPRWKGRRIADRYELRSWVGAGAMGVVFEAWDHELDRSVALKMMHPTLVDPERGAARFLIEAEAMAAVQHPNVARIHDRGRTSEGELYLVMEFVEGNGLDAIIERAVTSNSDESTQVLQGFLTTAPAEPSYLRSAVHWIRDIALGLDCAHGCGIVHRDVKPSNVLLGRDGNPVLVDFGIAAREGMETLTRGNTGIGTPAYMAPEVIRGGKNREAASDVYSLAATLHHLVARRPPYEGTVHEVLAAIASREPTPANQVRPGIPRDLQAILDRGLHRNPRRRYESMAAFAADLTAVLEFQPVAARPVSPITRLGRRLGRSRMFRGALLALIGVLSLGGLRVWQTARAAQASELYAQLPPAFSIGRTDLRQCTSNRERSTLQALLDGLVDTSSSSIPARVLRAAFRWDHDDGVGAAADMRVVAGELGTGFARALAAEYAAAAEGETAISLDGLPAPSEPEDEYLLIHEYARCGRFGPAMELLRGAAPEAVPHAEEIRLAGILVGAAQPEQTAREGLEALRLLESRLGGPTATTENLRGRFLTVLGRFAEARVQLRAAVTLAPHSHKIRINAGWAAYRDGDADGALEHLEVAMSARPQHDLAFGHAVRALAEAGRIEQAREVLQRGPWDQASASYFQQSSLIDTELVLEWISSGEQQRAQDLAQAVLGELEAHELTGTDLRRALLEAVAGGAGSAFAAACRYVRDDPYQWRRRSLLLRLMPEDLDRQESAAVRSVLEGVGVYMAARPDTHVGDAGSALSTPTDTESK